jgi:hypothetical protein
MRDKVEYLNNFFPNGVPDWAIPILAVLVWIGGLFRQFLNWIWQRLKSIFVEYPVTKQDVADIKEKMEAFEKQMEVFEQRQFEGQKTMGRIEAFLEQTEPLYKEINAFFAKYNEPRE